MLAPISMGMRHEYVEVDDAFNRSCQQSEGPACIHRNGLHGPSAGKQVDGRRLKDRRARLIIFTRRPNEL